MDSVLDSTQKAAQVLALLGKRGDATSAQIAVLSCVCSTWRALLTVEDRRIPGASRVLDWLYIGNEDSARQVERLQELDAAVCSVVVNRPELPTDMISSHFPVSDTAEDNIDRFFDEACSFIDACRRRSQRVLVHCLWGKSRSATIVLAYLMMRCQMPLAIALQRCLRCRPFVKPNQGFLVQLVKKEIAIFGGPSDLRKAAICVPPAWQYIRWRANQESSNKLQYISCHGLLLESTKVLNAPRMALVKGFLTKEEAGSIIDLARKKLHPSRVVSHSNDGTLAEQISGRTSYSCKVTIRESKIVREVVQRAAYLTSLKPSHSEPVQVVHYTPGQEYRPHMDWFDPSGANFTKTVQNGGQRLVTVFCYLTDCKKGGCTYFPELDKRFTPIQGAALMWYNMDRKGNEDRRTLHAGEPVEEGEKWGMNIFLRANPRNRLGEDSTESS
ncbi:hypothetical protein CYMTET_49869 [Cymbomonas tetramitiformis]|uniref:Protein-tyrosine-phosphatase n=1 Tax=Cymbomonas tetramitiformis TaxID=36881 RepID=A0AAE0BPB5_9CHLO|nr:hypothetical protein CYMTET_49869 [Cymbomonas tetramitiformis]